MLQDQDECGVIDISKYSINAALLEILQSELEKKNEQIIFLQQLLKETYLYLIK